MGFDTKDVQVKLTSGRIVRIPVIATTTTQQVCEKVAEEEKAPADVITLKFGGKVLKRSQTMWGYGVREEMELKVKLLKKETLKVHLHLPRLMLLPGNDKDVVSLDIYNTSANSEILSKLKATPSVYIQYHYTLHIGDMTLEMKNCAYEDCLKDGENIIVKCTNGPKMAVDWEKEMGDGERQEVLNSFASSMTSRRKVDIVFSFDTSGDMFSLLPTVQDHLRDAVTRLMSDIPNIQIGLMAHGDYCDETSYVIRKHDISANMADLVQFVEETTGSGEEGRSEPYACYEWALRHANGLSWREDAAKALVVIGDVVPHPSAYTDMNISWRDELQDLCDKDVKVYGVQALSIYYSYTDNYSKSFYSYISRKSGGAHINFKHFSLITDMFLAACYRESGDEEIKAYVDEVEKEGRMTEEMMDVMKQLEKKSEEEDKEEEKEKGGKAEQKTEGEASVDAAAGEAEVAQPSPQRQQEEKYVRMTWWDPTLDQLWPRFTYNNETDFWTRAPPVDWEHFLRKQSRMKRMRKLKKNCSVM